MTEHNEMTDAATSMERGSGVALWRQIADRIRLGIVEGEFVEGGKLPAEIALAERFEHSSVGVTCCDSRRATQVVVHAASGEGAGDRAGCSESIGHAGKALRFEPVCRACQGMFVEGGKLPAEIALAERFGVNRHTVRGAIAALVQEGVLRAEQGRGTFVEQARRISYAVSRRTRFSANLGGQAREAYARLLSHSTDPATPRIAAQLDLAAGAPVLRLETLSFADKHPLARATHWFEAQRFSGMADAFAATGSITSAFARCGVHDYLRRSTTVTARHADAAMLEALALSPGAIVLVNHAVNEDIAGKPIQLSETLFAADRVELQLLGDERS